MRRSPRQVGLRAGIVLTIITALTIAAAPAASADPIPDLSSVAAIESYLLSIGVDPGDAVWQEGLQNYAGPSCPGVGWNCVAANAPIVQIADPDGTNLFKCTGSDCVAVQVALSAGQNGAVCDRGDKHANDAVQVCEVTQANTTGNNVAVINQNIQQKGPAVTARQVARITQVNDSGKNSARFHQVISQSSKIKWTNQSQEAHQAATLDQHNGSGDNTSDIDQRQSQTENAPRSTTLTQQQNATAGTDVLLSCDRPGDSAFDQAKNQCAEVSQESSLSAGGGNHSELEQLISERQIAGRAVDVEQDQGTFDGGQGGTVSNTARSPQNSKATQDMGQVQSASGVTGNLFQSQITGDPRCCQTQDTNVNNTAEITQTTDQQASDPNAFQDAVLQGDCDSTGSCHVVQSATIDGNTESDECGPDVNTCHIFTFNNDGGD